MKKLAIRFLNRIASDFYRMMAAILDWKCHVRVLKGQPRYDVAFITNVNSETDKRFVWGLFSKHVPFNEGLRVYLGNDIIGRYKVINSSALQLLKEPTKEIGRNQVRKAIAQAINDGAKVILYAAGTKRLFKPIEQADICKDNQEAKFTIGDNGTEWALMEDTWNAIKAIELNKGSKILVIGPNGFLGSAVLAQLAANGYYNVVTASSQVDNPFDKIEGVELAIACSHLKKVKLTKNIIDMISSKNGIYVVDVCEPENFTAAELEKCGSNVGRQDSGIVYNAKLKYVFTLGALFVLKALKLSPHRLFGCFAESMSIASKPTKELEQYDLLKVNDKARAFVMKTMVEQGFTISKPTNFGKKTRIGHAERADSYSRTGVQAEPTAG